MFTLFQLTFLIIKNIDGEINNMRLDNINKIDVLMVGVDSKRVGGMWTVANTYITNKKYNKFVNLSYVATSTGGSAVNRVLKMLTGYLHILFILCCKHIDIVHIHMAEKGSVYRKGIVIGLAKLFQTKIVVQMHAGPIMDWYDKLDNRQKITVNQIFNNCDKMLVLGEYWIQQLFSILPKNKLAVLYNGTKCPSQNEYNADGNYILFLGMVTEKKGAYDLIEAISLINEKLPSTIKVAIAGEDYDHKAQIFAQNKGLKDRIAFLGWINTQQKEKLFSNTIMCVLPSYFEGLSMTVIESMAHGIPILTTNISTMPEVVGTNYKVIEPGNISDLAQMILEFANDKELRLRSSEYLFKRATSLFSEEAMIDKTLNIYKMI